MFVLLLLNKLDPRRRVVSGVVCTAAGIVWVAVAALAAPGLVVHGVVLAVTGGILWLSGALAHRKARAATKVTTTAFTGGR